MIGSKTLVSLGFVALTVVAGSALAQTAAPAMKSSPPMMAKPATTMLDINTASVADLQALKGVGEKRAADIVKGPTLQGQGRSRAEEDPAAGRLRRHQGQDHRQAEIGPSSRRFDEPRRASRIAAEQTASM